MGQTEIKRCGPPEATREAGANGAGTAANARGSSGGCDNSGGGGDQWKRNKKEIISFKM